MAQRIVQFADSTGPKRVQADPDCGFSTFANISQMDAGTSLLELRAPLDARRTAMQRLWVG